LTPGFTRKANGPNVARTESLGCEETPNLNAICAIADKVTLTRMRIRDRRGIRLFFARNATSSR